LLAPVCRATDDHVVYGKVVEHDTNLKMAYDVSAVSHAREDMLKSESVLHRVHTIQRRSAHTIAQLHQNNTLGWGRFAHRCLGAKLLLMVSKPSNIQDIGLHNVQNLIAQHLAL